MNERAVNLRLAAMKSPTLAGAGADQSPTSPTSARNANRAENQHIQSQQFTLSGSYVFAKRAADISVALALAVVFCPVILLVMLALRREAGAVIVGHTRIGKNGKEFRALKFRTMIPNASHALREMLNRNPQSYQLWIRNQSLKDDPRMTSTGKFLRKTSIEQLPKLWNVLKGDMSLVGPRPITREDLRKYGSAARYYLACKPGLTGFWQVAGGSNRDYRRRIAMDRQYALNASLWIDLVILFNSTSLVLQRQRPIAVEADDCQSASGEDSDIQYGGLNHQE